MNNAHTMRLKNMKNSLANTRIQTRVNQKQDVRHEPLGLAVSTICMK